MPKLNSPHYNSVQVESKEDSAMDVFPQPSVPCVNPGDSLGVDPEACTTGEGENVDLFDRCDRVAYNLAVA